MKFIFLLFLLSLKAFASSQLSSSPPTCQFPASFLTYVDQIGDDPDVLVRDPELKFFKETMKLRDDDIQHTADDAVKFFNEHYGLDFSLSPPNDEFISLYENATLSPYFLNDIIEYKVALNNWIQTGSTRSTCYRIYEGGFVVTFSGAQILRGSYGGADGILVGERESVLYGFYSITSCKQSPVIIQFQSATPTRHIEVDRATFINYELYNRVLGYGKAVGVITLSPTDKPGSFHVIVRVAITFDY